MSLSSVIEQARQNYRLTMEDPIMGTIEMEALQALAEHDASLTWEKMTVRDVGAVVLLLGERIFSKKATWYAEEYPVSGDEGSIDKSVAMQNCINMAASLRQQYEHSVNTMEIVVGSLKTINIINDRMVPYAAASPPKKPTLIINSPAAGIVTFDWDTNFSENWRRTEIYLNEGTVLDPYRPDGITEGVFPKEGVWSVYTLKWKFTNVLPGTYNCLIRIVDYNHLWAASEELTVVVR